MISIGWKLAVTGLVTTAFFLFSLIIAPMLMPLFVMVGMLLASATLAAAPGFSEWTASEGLEGPLILLLMATAFGFLILWLTGFVIWCGVERIRRKT